VNAALPIEHRESLSTALAGRRDAYLALTAVLISAVFFLAAAPFAKTPLPQVPVFVPIYASALVMCDLVTAILLFGQFVFLRSRALLLLANGYLLTAALAVSQTLVFPGVFAPTGLFGVGPQLAPWIYILWHAVFPLAVIAYALLKDGTVGPIATGGSKRGPAWAAILFSATAVLLVVCGLTLMVTAGYLSLPNVLQDNRITTAGRIAIGSGWVLSALALLVLLARKRRTVLDLWLMVVMCAWIFDVALAAILNAGRYDLGWYAGRIYGLLAASFVLGVFLIENSLQFARLTQFSAQLSAANKLLEQLTLQDELTGVANRRCFDTYLAEQLAVARRHKRMLSLIVCDIDAFKNYNDCYGHLAGDECLKQVAAALRSCCRRPADLTARYGGEEFALILPDTDLGGSASIAEEAREAVAQLRMPHERSAVAPYVTISGGCAVLVGEIYMTESQLIGVADKNLYEAKRLGRNRIICV